MSPLVSYTLRGLLHCYQPEQFCWSYSCHFGNAKVVNESIPPRDCFYTLNVILGLAVAGPEAWQGTYDLPGLLHYNAARLKTLNVRAYALGMALWAAARLGERLNNKTVDYIYALIHNRKRWEYYTAQDAGMILSGLCEQKLCNMQPQDKIAHALFRHIRMYYLTENGLFRNNAHGVRKNYTSFASQCYLINACYLYGRAYDNIEALAIADKVTKRMLELQGEDGSWPWFYHAPSASVVDEYELYSVHQHGMSSLFLTIAEQRGIPGAREAIYKGFSWIDGQNILGRTMTVPELGLFYRSIVRKNEKRSRIRRALRSLRWSKSAKPDAMKPETLTVRRECRSYELGWLLYSFAKSNKHEITHHPIFGPDESIRVRSSPQLSDATIA